MKHHTAAHRRPTPGRRRKVIGIVWYTVGFAYLALVFWHLASVTVPFGLFPAPSGIAGRIAHIPPGQVMYPFMLASLLFFNGPPETAPREADPAAEQGSAAS